MTKAIVDEVSSDTSFVTETWGTDPQPILGAVMVARTLLSNRMNELPVRLLNVTDEPIKLGKHTVVSELEPLRPVDAREVQLDHQCVEDPIVNEMVDKIDSIVPDNIKDKLKQMLMKYSSIFSREEWDLGWTDIVTHRIDTANNRPFRQPLRRYPLAHVEAIDKHLTDMLQQNVIEPASNLWVSNIVGEKERRVAEMLYRLPST